MHRPIEKHPGNQFDCRLCNPALARDAQAVYVERWRAEHPNLVFDLPWICPLCGEAVQRRTAAYPSDHAAAVQRWINYHTEAHGDAWRAYEAAAPAAE
jgi:hypothetical protein